MKKKPLGSVVICTSILLLSLSGVSSGALAFASVQFGITPASQPNSVTPTKIVSLSIIIDEANHFDELADWLRDLNFRNFTFVVVEGTTNAYILENATRLNTLKQYGEIIPRLSFMQGYAPSNRILNANFTLNEFADALGYVPKGVMDFVPDTYTSQYLLTRGVEYYQGYCFDQYNVDRMTTRGGFQMPYYANQSNILCPSQSTGGMVVLPHSTWDWSASFTVSHNLQLHPLNLMNMKYPGNQTAKAYVLSMLDDSLAGSSPFGYVTVQFEWSWLFQDGDVSQVLDWIRTLLSTRPSYRYLTFEDTVDWFRGNYEQTPTYRINFASPFDGTRIEWYYSLSGRVARVDEKVVSYVDYTRQQPDRYLESFTPLFWGSPSNSTNSLDNSLSFKIDALGGGALRATVSTEAVPFDGDLQYFETYYVEMNLANSMRQQVFALGSIVLVVFSTVVAFRVKRRRKGLSSKD